METGGTAQMKRARVRVDTSAKDKYMKAKNCLMNDGWEMYTLCGNPLCIILFDHHSQHPQTWPSSSVAVNSVIDHYRSTTASAAPGKKKYVNLTLSDLGLIPPNMPWEKELYPGMLHFPLQELEAMNTRIDDTLSKIDAMLMTPRVLGEIETVSGCDSETEWNSVVRMLDCDDDILFPGEGSGSNNSLCTYAGENQDLFPDQMPLFCADPQGLFGWNNQPAANDQVQFQMHDCCNDLDWPVNVDKCPQYGVETVSIFNTFFNGQ